MPISEPSDTYLVSAIVPKKNGAASSTASGWMKSAAPMPVATPRPPWKRRNTDAHAPTTAATPVSATARGEAPSKDATATGTKPLSTSSVATATARRAPIARSAFVPPVRPLPTVRGSTAPVSRATRTPIGNEPDR